MRTFKIIAAVALLCVVSAVSFYVGRKYEYNHFGKKDFEAACLQADFIRYLIDHFDGETRCFNIGAEIENSYEEYFGDIEEMDTSIKSIKEFDNYYWCY